VPNRPQAEDQTDDHDDDDPVGANTDHAGLRLQKVLARAGMGSRRRCDDLIAAGRVSVNGERADLGRRIDPENDQVTIDGTPIPVKPGLVHYLLNKPAGTVSTADDPQGRPTVVSLVPADPPVYPVGRLDLDTEGLILVTNDGELTYRLTHPKFGLEKEYLAKVTGTPTRGAVRRLRDGIELDDGPTAPAVAALVAPGLIRITIHEGRNRQVRRMCEAIGHPVERLVRTRIGPLTDRKLKPGTWRMLSTDEVVALERAANVEADPRAATQQGPKRANRPPAERRAERDAAAAARAAAKAATAANRRGSRARTRPNPSRGSR
jgi:23S rRNA pseudouridine2605 synthase